MRTMRRSVVLADDDRRLFRELIEDLNLTQKELAETAEVERIWLNQVLTGRRKSRIDGVLMEKVASRLVGVVKQQLEQGQISNDRGASANLFLSRFSSVLSKRNRIHTQGG